MSFIIFILMLLTTALATATDDETVREATLTPPYLPVSALTNRFAIAAMSETNKTVFVEIPGFAFRLFGDSRRMEFNNTLIWLNGGMLGSSNAWLLSETDIETVLAPLLEPAVPATSPPPPFVVVLDPGHGGSDPGAPGPDTITEKQIVLDIARRVRRQLKAAGVSVRMTRSIDRHLVLTDRARLAKRWKAQAFISIHANHAPNTAARGIETFVVPAAGFAATSSSSPVPEALPGNRHDADTTRLAYAIHRHMIARTAAPDRGIKRARFEVLANAPCPAVLVEVGFLSNEADVKVLQQSVYREKLAAGITEGILKFKSHPKTPDD